MQWTHDGSCPLRSDRAARQTLSSFTRRWPEHGPLKITPEDGALEFSATLSEDGRWLTLFAVNDGLSPLTRSMDLSSFLSGAADVQVVTLGDTQHTGHPDVTNGFDDPHRVYPVPSSFHAGSPSLTYNFPPLSLTVLRLKRK